ncbi:MAG: O-phosphoseryl-tRNA(Sec) selenium transferase [Promethearchaeati archaeon SRVP18_Atabeyarchaeia-1]
MSDKLEEYLEGFLPKAMLRRSEVAFSSQLNLIRNLFKQRRIPQSGWPDHVIGLLMRLLSMMDTDKDIDGIRIGEREARVASPLVSELAWGFCHGVGRSGSLLSPQPKAPGASVLYGLANKCALDAMQKLGAFNLKSAIVSPVATGMSIALALAATRDSIRGERDTVVFARVDHDSPLKAMNLVNLKARVIEGKTYDDAVRVPVTDIAEAIDKRCSAILSTTTFFPPRETDSIADIARIASEQNIPHIINNAYGAQSRETMREIRLAIDAGRVDAVVQSTDKNFLTPVGGAIIASPDEDFAEKVASSYVGRASASPIYQFLASILSVGIDGYERLRDAQESNRKLLETLLGEAAESCGERMLKVKSPIACAMTVSNADPSLLGGILYSLRVSGPRVIPRGSRGSCCDNYPYSYVVVNAAIGSTETDIFNAVEKLKEGMKQTIAKRTGKREPDHTRPQR